MKASRTFSVFNVISAPLTMLIRDQGFLLKAHLLLQTLLLASEERQATMNKQLGLCLKYSTVSPDLPKYTEPEREEEGMPDVCF